MDPVPTVAIVGRPNVGKSTLFNRLIGKRHAIVAHEAGTTRDRISQKFDCGGYNILLVDTGGLQYGKHENIEADVQAQAKLAIEDADLTLFVVDISQELTVDDFAAADILRKSKKPVILVANKSDNKNLENNVFNFYELGFDEPIQISAIHKLGIETLKHKITDTLGLNSTAKSKKKATSGDDTINLCILGKPNAGKSSLVNALTDSNKLIVSDIAGTTRDSTDTEFKYENNLFNLIDTAGLKRPGKTGAGIEKFSSLRVLKAIERADIVVLLIDGEIGITSQDCHIVEHALREEKGLIMAINKIDLFESGEEKRSRMTGSLKRRFAFVAWAPVVFVSAKNKRNTFQILKLATEIMKERKKRISTAELNGFLQKITQKHLPASRNIKKPKFMYASQVDTEPPKFVVFLKHATNMHFSYPRYLENEIRKEFGFNGTAIGLKFKNQTTDGSK